VPSPLPHPLLLEDSATWPEPAPVVPGNSSPAGKPSPLTEGRISMSRVGGSLAWLVR